MVKKILVTYATWAGTTHDIAVTIGEALRTNGADVTVQRASGVKTVRGYDAVIAGTGIHAGMIHRDMKRFVKTCRKELSTMPVAYFIVCLMMADDTEATRDKVRAFLHKLMGQVPEVRPVDIGLFAGAILTSGEDFDRLSFIWKKIMVAMGKKQVDKRDYGKVKEWSEKVWPRM